MLVLTDKAKSCQCLRRRLLVGEGTKHYLYQWVRPRVYVSESSSDSIARALKASSGQRLDAKVMKRERKDASGHGPVELKIVGNQY